MRIALLADLHANLAALEAVLVALERHAPERIVILGDLVGYGPDPGAVLEIVAGLAARGAMVVRGNHDEAVALGLRNLTENARDAARWTRGQLSEAQCAWLMALPLTIADGERLYVHASAETPERWRYLGDADAAARCLAATTARDVFCGHLHVPAIYYAQEGRDPVRFRPAAEVEAPLLRRRRHVVVVGSVGQPRDGDPAAAFALLDTELRTLTLLRAPYDVEATIGRIRAAGLPPWLGERLRHGR